VNYNQVVVNAKFYNQNFNMQKFQNMKYSNSRTFQKLSKTYSVYKDFQEPGLFFKIQGLLKTSQGPYKPCYSLNYCQLYPSMCICHLVSQSVNQSIRTYLYNGICH